MRNFAPFAVVVLAACSPDLPAGWDGAERIAITQKDCAGSPYGDDAPKERATATRSGAAIGVQYLAAHFRCAQAVEGFLRRDGATAGLLVQPVDMTPGAVAGCDCLYDITSSIPDAATVTSVEVWRRWDAINVPNEPVKIAVVTP